MKLSVSQWKYAKEWVYSITYDEALSDLDKFVIPVHQRLGIPGHVEVVAGQIGEIRNCGSSSYNGMRHMDRCELRNLVAMGWGIGNHSWTHGKVINDPERELLEAKQKIELETDYPVTCYTAPGSNYNLTVEVLEKLREYCYLGAMSITDDLNYADADDLLWINRVPIHEEYPGVFATKFDPFKRLRLAAEKRGWLVDYLHCPLEKAVHPQKDVNQAHFRERLETVAGEGGQVCWFANPDRVIDYRYMRKFVQITETESGGFSIDPSHVPAEVHCREMTFILASPLPPECVVVHLDSKPVPICPLANGLHHFTVEISDRSTIEVRNTIPA